MKKRVYIETSVVSYYAAHPSRDPLTAAHQEATRRAWPILSERFETFISALVFEEVGRGDPKEARKRLEAIGPFPILAVDDEAESLAERIVGEKGVPAGYPEDALHIAVAAVNGIDVVLTWNLAHLNNPFTRMMIRQIVESAGYRSPELCSPEELLEAIP